MRPYTRFYLNDFEDPPPGQADHLDTISPVLLN